MLPAACVAGAALRLLTDDGLHRQFGEAGRRRAVEKFGQDTVVHRYRSIYQRLTQLP